VPGEIILNLTVAGYGLTGSGPRVLIPIVTPAVSDQNASVLLDLADKI
jgi:hypothetical protein